jgi:hypothetical protein
VAAVLGCRVASLEGPSHDYLDGSGNDRIVESGFGGALLLSPQQLTGREEERRRNRIYSLLQRDVDSGLPPNCWAPAS